MSNTVWKAVARNNTVKIYHAKRDDLPMATVHLGAGTPKQQIETANLMAAAPELLAALEEARAALPDAWAAVKCNVPKDVIDQINAAIAKAKGEQP